LTSVEVTVGNIGSKVVVILDEGKFKDGLDTFTFNEYFVKAITEDGA
jgi:hypothetical protein